MQLHPKQVEAVELCLDGSKRIVAITGAAGTGKTTIIRKIADELKEKNITFAIAAPTGKAAKRIFEATGYAAQTIHRLLEYPRPGERDVETGKPLTVGDPKRGRDNPLEQHVIICDEYAMVNNELDRNVIDALRRGGRLLVFGDIHQLSPIEDKNQKVYTQSPFERHLARASVHLDMVFRQAEDGGILESADRIRKGRMPRRYPDFEMKFTERPIASIKQYVLAAKEAGVDFALPTNQIIVPVRKTWVGTVVLNTALRDLLNPDGVRDYSLELPRNKWDENDELYVSVGDKVVCTENTYDMRNYYERYADLNDKGNPVETSYIECPPSKFMLNGETGIITDIHSDGSVEIDFGDRTVEVPSSYAEYSWKKDTVFDKDPRVALELAYALTTHKCQGSEYKRVVYLINRSCGFMLNRKNFYTAVTRAKEHVLLITDQPGINLALREEQKK